MQAKPGNESDMLITKARRSQAGAGNRSVRRLRLAALVVPATLACFAAFASAAFAGNFFATGHDQDFHCDLGGAPSADECA